MKKATVILFSVLFMSILFTSFYAGVALEGSTDWIEQKYDFFTIAALVVVPISNLLAICYFNYRYIWKSQRLANFYRKFINLADKTDTHISQLTYKDFILFFTFLLSLYLFYFFATMIYYLFLEGPY